MMISTAYAHALAYEHMRDLRRTADQQRRLPARTRRPIARHSAAAVLRWLRRGQLGPVPAPSPASD